MGDLFHEKADRDLFFSSFANDIGTQLDQLKFEFEEIESGKTKVQPEVKPEVKPEDQVDSSRLESRVQNEIEKNLSDGAASEHDKDHHRSRTFTMMRAFSTVSLMANFKTGFWRRKRGSKKNNKGRRGSTTSNPENNNNTGVPKIEINGESEGRSTIYSTVPRQPKNGNRNQILSPTRLPNDPDLPEQLHRTESGNVFVPPVIIDGQIVHDYQYVTPETSPKHNEGKFYRRNSLSRLLRIRKSPKKSPKKVTTPIKQLYEKTVLTASNNELNRVHENETPQQNGVAKVEPRKPLSST